MFQAVLIMKSEKESTKMHQISIPEGEIRSILYQRHLQLQDVSGKEENTRKQILQGRLFG
jgi:hypothetical protein